MIKISVDKILDESFCCGIPGIRSVHFYILMISCSWIDSMENSFTSYENGISIFACWNLLLNNFNFSVLVVWYRFWGKASVKVCVYGWTNGELCCLAVEKNCRSSITVFTTISTSCEMNDVTPSINNLLWEDLKWDVPCWSKRWYHFYQVISCNLEA